MTIKLQVSALLLISLLCKIADAAETTSYSYDAKGRLIKIVKVGGPSNGSTATYDQDKSDNRTRVITSGMSR